MKERRPALLDGNVLIALAWPNHVQNRAVTFDARIGRLLGSRDPELLSVQT